MAKSLWSSKFGKGGKLGAATVHLHYVAGQWIVVRAGIHIEKSGILCEIDCEYLGKGKPCKFVDYPALLRYCREIYSTLGQDILMERLMGFIKIEFCEH